LSAVNFNSDDRSFSEITYLFARVFDSSLTIKSLLKARWTCKLMHTKRWKRVREKSFEK